MPDIADIANDSMALVDGARINTIRGLAEHKDALPTGECLNCEELLTRSDQRWCDADCRDRWEKGRFRD